MIGEFALEPELVATWHDRKEYLFFEEKFGLRTGRVISAYPKKWQNLVWRAFKSGPHANNENAEMRLNALLTDLTQSIVKRRNTFEEIPVWLERAEAEHAQRPFHALVAKENPRNNEKVIPVMKLINEGHCCWDVADMPPTARNAHELAAAVAPILRTCRQIVFIDPYFDPQKPRFMEPMAAFLREIWACGYCEDNPRVEIHTSIDRLFKDYERGASRNPDEEEKACSNLVHYMNEFLPRIIPSGKELHVTIWKQCERGQKLHNRYILTELCGVAFGIGLDQSEDQSTAETDDLSLMNSKQYSDRWNEYLGNPAAFDRVAPQFTITGTLRI